MIGVQHPNEGAPEGERPKYDSIPNAENSALCAANAYEITSYANTEPKDTTWC